MNACVCYVASPQVDFLGSNNASLDPLVHLHSQDAHIRAKYGASLKDLMVSKGAIRLALQNGLAMPRNGKTHPDNREAVGGYIYGRFGRLGLLTVMQTFQTTNRQGMDELAAASKRPRV